MSTSSSSGGPAEDCTNGVDDDNNGQVDCADSACAMTGYQCVGAVPLGWNGPVAFSLGGAPGPDCGANWAALSMLGGDVVVAPQAQCSCSCGNAAVGCQTSISLYTDDECMIPGAGFVLSSACTSFGVNNAMSAKVFLNKTDGPCPPVTAPPVLPPASFAKQGFVCTGAATGGGCAVGICAPAAPSPFPAPLCVYQDGDVACPSADYKIKTLVYKDFAEGRSCSACTCGQPFNTACPGSVPIATDNACTAVFQNAGVGLCYGGGPFNSAVSNFMGTGTCSPQGGTPQGAVMPQTPITVCCSG